MTPNNEQFIDEAMHDFMSTWKLGSYEKRDGTVVPFSEFYSLLKDLLDRHAQVILSQKK